MIVGQHGGSVGNGGLNSKLYHPYHVKLRQLDPLIFLDTLVHVMVVENREHIKACSNGLDTFF